MKVMFFVFSDKKGLGGHYRSLKEVFKAQSRENECYIINIGESPSPVLSSEKNYFYLNGSIPNILRNLSRVRKLICHYDIEVLHAFDSYSYFYVRLLSFLYHIPSVYTKAGGANNLYTPKSLYTTLFSEENRIYLSERNEGINYSVIPNRVSKVHENKTLIRKIEKLLGDDVSKVFLRISRIDQYYLSTNLDSISYVSEYAANFKERVAFVLIGKIYDQEAFNTIVNFCHSGNVRLLHLSADEFTKDASSLLGVAHYVFGSGRGAMEALSLRKIVICPTKSSSVPQIVEPSNFKSFLEYNFSARALLKNVKSFSEQIAILESESDLAKLKEHNHKLFKNYCDVDGAVLKYYDIYKRATETRKGFFFKDFIFNSYRYIHRNIPFREKLKRML